MKCPRCQHDYQSHAKFCLECGARLALVCAKCQSELPSKFSAGTCACAAPMVVSRPCGRRHRPILLLGGKVALLVARMRDNICNLGQWVITEVSLRASPVGRLGPERSVAVAVAWAVLIIALIARRRRRSREVTSLNTPGERSRPNSTQTAFSCAGLSGRPALILVSNPRLSQPPRDAFTGGSM